MRKYVQMGQGGGVIHHPPPGAGVDRAQGKPRQKDSRCRPETGYMYPRSELPTSCHTRRTASDNVYSVSLLDSKKVFQQQQTQTTKKRQQAPGFYETTNMGPKRREATPTDYSSVRELHFLNSSARTEFSAPVELSGVRI